MVPVVTEWNQAESLFSYCLYKTRNMSQNPKHDLTILKTGNTTKSKTWLKVSSKSTPKMSLYKIKNLSADDLDTQPSPTKNAVCQTLTCKIL